ncbi:hypothetical protein TNCV_4654061 [Trichonephila clavipes]|nr:hypothetical protein TNCV_4654061 [Trichonephila clavipes]
MLIQPASSQPRLLRGTVVLLENSITVQITEEYKRMEYQPGMQDPWLHESDAIFSDAPRYYVVGIETHHSFPVLYTPVSVLSCPGKTCSLMKRRIEQWYSRMVTAPETHMVKLALHSSFTDSTTGTVIQLDESSQPESFVIGYCREYFSNALIAANIPFTLYRRCIGYNGALNCGHGQANHTT